MGQQGDPAPTARDIALVWVVAIAFFAALFVASWADVPKLVIVAGVVLLAVALFAIAIARNLQQTRRFQRENLEALAMIARGELEAAQSVYERWRASPLPQVKYHARYNLAWALMRRGELDRALEVGHDLGQAPTAARYLHALVAALAGDLSLARASLARAQARTHADMTPFLSIAVLARAIVGIRGEELVDAQRRLDEAWPSLELRAQGDTLRVLRVVRAFLRASDVREAGNVEIELRGLAPLYTGEFRFLGARWPEMAAFLASHSLA